MTLSKIGAAARSKRLLHVALLGAAALAVSACSSKTKNGVHGPDLIPGVNIIYSANVDGEIEPCGCRSNPLGGINRRYAFQFRSDKLDKLEQLVLESGDLFYQSAPVPPFLEKQWNYQASVLATAYNAFGVEAFAPGELDFAAGLDQFQKLVKGAKYQVVSANLVSASTGKPLWPSYVILMKGGKRVGIFGLYDETLPLPPEIGAKDHIAAATAMVKELRGKVDVILALTHEGFDKDMELAKAVSGIDAIFGAHTQSFLIQPERVGDTLIFQPSFRAQHLGVYVGGENKMFQIDDRFESKPDEEHLVDKLLKTARVEIGRINREAEAELMGGAKPLAKTSGPGPGFQTFAKCATCHAPQYEFHKDKRHSHAFQTLVKAKQQNNLECLGCHTVGAGSEQGWLHVKNLVLNAAGKGVSAENFAKSLPSLGIAALSKNSKTYINVQCENCHGMGGGHPMSLENNKIARGVSTSTCVQCHTAERAPGWYKQGKLDETVAAAKLKSMTCPVAKR